MSEEDQRILNEHLLLAQELFRLDTKKNDLEALAEIRSALKMDKRSVAAQSWNLLISSQLALRNPGFISLSRARVLLKKADPELIKTAEGRSGRALVYLSEKNYSGARVVAENLVSENPNYGLGYWVLAQIETGGAVIKYEEAEGLLQKAVALDPNLVQARFALAEINFQQKKYEPALAQFQETLKLSPEHSEAAARLKEIQALLARANPPEEKPGGGVLIAKPGPVPGATSQMGTTAGPQPMLIPISPVTGATTGAPSVQVDLDQELQKMLLQIIAETRPPLSRGKNSAPITSPSPTPVQPTPAPLPPEETPGQPGTTRPPEEAP